MILYSTDCPKCKILEKKLNLAGKEYTTIKDIDEIMSVANKFGIMEAPFIVEGDSYYNFSNAVKALNEGKL